MTVYQHDQSELEDTSDVVKTAVLTALVRDGLLDPEVADDWSARHCVKISKKTIWRTLTDRWRNEPESKGILFTVVGYSKHGTETP